MRAAHSVAFLRTESNRTRRQSRQRTARTATLTREGKRCARTAQRPGQPQNGKNLLLHRFRAARAAEKASAAAPVPTPAPAAQPAAPATVDSLGAQLREVLPTRRLHSVS